MNATAVRVASVLHRNFNLCPHCVFHGQQALLYRLSEGIPMISRSDGKLFHLLLADRPMPYPAEKHLPASTQVSVCFWYSHVGNADETLSTIVLLPKSTMGLFRQIDRIADHLAELLTHSERIAGMYEFARGTLTPVQY